jgi:septal ring factor EnvC (AmiA/AmiB activator)
MPLDPETVQFFENLFRSLEAEMGQRFDRVDERFDRVEARLDRMDATLTLHNKQLGAGTRTIAAFTEWVSKADADYTRVLAEMEELKGRIAKLEGKN